MNIHVSTEEVRDLASRMSIAGEDLESIITRLDSMINQELGTVMTGMASDSYVAQYVDVQRAPVAGRQLVEEISVQLNSIVTGFEERDSDMSSQVNA